MSTPALWEQQIDEYGAPPNCDGWTQFVLERTHEGKPSPLPLPVVLWVQEFPTGTCPNGCKARAHLVHQASARALYRSRGADPDDAPALQVCRMQGRFVE